MNIQPSCNPETISVNNALDNVIVFNRAVRVTVIPHDSNEAFIKFSANAVVAESSAFMRSTFSLVCNCLHFRQNVASDKFDIVIEDVVKNLITINQGSGCSSEGGFLKL